MFGSKIKIKINCFYHGEMVRDRDRLGNDQDIEFQDIKIGVFQDR